MTRSLEIDFQALARRYDSEAVRAIVLMGSHARGDAGPFSDIDLVRFVDQPAGMKPAAGSYLVDDRLVVVSDVFLDDIDSWFTDSRKAVEMISGLRTAIPLIDTANTFAPIQARAHNFTWNKTLQDMADNWTSQQMVGWIEEVHKGLEGLRRGHSGRLLNARFGLSWGLTRLMAVSKAVLISGDNGWFEEVANAVGRESEWTRLQAVAFGVAGKPGEPPSLSQSVKAGLRLYQETAALLSGTLRPEDRPLVERTADRIEQQLKT
jgi:hypothetical protein